MKNIGDWAPDDRPREKMRAYGVRKLTDSELLAVIFGSGTKELNAVDLGRTMLIEKGIRELAENSLEEFMETKGVGLARATKLCAVFEIARRLNNSCGEKQKTVSSSNDAFQILKKYLSGLKHEEFYTILLNRANRVLSVEKISSGGLSGTVADGKLIYRKALLKHSSALILAHNHPSGSLKPSQADLNLTKKLKEFGEMVGFQVLDHLIISDNGYLSFADEGLI